MRPFTFASTLLLLLGLSVAQEARAQEIVDGTPATQRAGMHACPTPLFVTGHNAVGNTLLCGPPPAFGAVTGPEFVDGRTTPPTQLTIGGTTMHRCPPGTALTGINVAQNAFLCRGYIPASTPPTALQEDLSHNTATQTIRTYPWWCPFRGVCDFAATLRTVPNRRLGIRACPLGTVVVGVHVARDEFACGQIMSVGGFSALPNPGAKDSRSITRLQHLPDAHH